jgi:hypothetical protein
MFLYAKLVMENLLAQETLEDLLFEVDEYFPVGLEDAYVFCLACYHSRGAQKLINLRFKRILNRIKRSLPPLAWKRIQNLLGWMVCVRRPLRWNEIQALVSIDQSEQVISFAEKKLRSSLQELCGSLITILPEGRGLELVHNTAKM